MGLVKCPECGKEVSDKAVSCPGCGFPIVKEAGIANEDVHCQSCGHANSATSDYCESCGMRISLYKESQNVQDVSNSKDGYNQIYAEKVPYPGQTPTVKKKGHGCLTTIIGFFLICGVIGFVIQGTSGGSESKKVSNQSESISTGNVIFDSESYSRVSSSELIEKMGEALRTEDWVNKTSKGDFNLTTYEYEINDNHYEFLIADDIVVRLSIYSNLYWNNEGESFQYANENKSDIFTMFGITLSENAKINADTNSAFRVSPVNDKIAELNVQNIDINNKTFGLVKITYNFKYFD